MYRHGCATPAEVIRELMSVGGIGPREASRLCGEYYLTLRTFRGDGGRAVGFGVGNWRVVGDVDKRLVGSDRAGVGVGVLERDAGRVEDADRGTTGQRGESRESQVDSQALGVGSGARGPNWARNKASRERRKLSRRDIREQVSERDRGSRVGAGRAWSCVEQGVVNELQQSRAKRLIEENERAVVKARLDTQRLLEMERKGVVCREVKAKVAVLDGQLSGKYSLVGGERARGWVETVASTPSSSSADRTGTGSGKGVPSLSTGVSPSSSISVEESVKLIARNKELEGLLRDMKKKDLVGAENFRLKEEVRELVNEVQRLRGDPDAAGDGFGWCD